LIGANLPMQFYASVECNKCVCVFVRMRVQISVCNFSMVIPDFALFA